MNGEQLNPQAVRKSPDRESGAPHFLFSDLHEAQQLEAAEASSDRQGHSPEATKAPRIPATPKKLREARDPHEAALESKVRQGLDQSNVPAFRQLEVSVRKSAVTLSGEVASPAEKELALDIARRTPGVGKIFDLLTLSADYIPSTSHTPEKPDHAAMTNTPRTTMPYRAQPKRQSLNNPFRGFEFPVGLRSVACGVAVVAMVAMVGLAAAGVVAGGKLSLVPVAGKVLFHGQPPAGATVALYSSDAAIVAKGVRPTGNVDAAGAFKLSTYERDDGVPPGAYTATVVWFKGESDNLLPAVYSKPETSPLKIKVVSGETSLQPFELKK